MKYYLVKWPDATVTVVGANNKSEFFHAIDAIGDPGCAGYLRLPTAPFSYQIDLDVWDEARTDDPNWITFEEAETQLRRDCARGLGF